jgi:hypothetical protein
MKTHEAPNSPNITRKIASLMKYAGVTNPELEAHSLFAPFIRDQNRRRQFIDRQQQAVREHHGGLIPDIYVKNWPHGGGAHGGFSELMLDIKTIGFLASYFNRSEVRAVALRARKVPSDYTRKAGQVDVTYNGCQPGVPGPVSAKLASMPPVIGLAFGACGEWPTEVDKIVGHIADTGSLLPERFGCCHGAEQARGVIAQWARTHLSRTVMRETARVRHAALDIALGRTSSFSGDAEAFRRADGTPTAPGTANEFDRSGCRPCVPRAFPI